MIKGQVVSGDFSKIIMRIKSQQEIELGELVVIENEQEKFILQVYDLVYGSQISQQNLEMVAGMNLEEDSFQIIDEKLRNYQLALLKPILTIDQKSKTCKKLPQFFAKVREITKNDLSFITKPNNPLFLGQLRSGSKEMDFEIFLPGRDVLSHHVLIPASTGKGKSLDENEEVFIRQNNMFSIKPIGEIVNDANKSKTEVLSMNPKDYSMNFKEVVKFVKHKAPPFMYKVMTESGRKVMVTGDHNLYVLREGQLKLLKTEQVSNNDYLPLPLQIDITGNLNELNLFELLKNWNKVYVLYNKSIINKLKPKKECLKILAKYFTRPSQRYDHFFIKKNKIKIVLLNELLKTKLSPKELKTVELTDQHHSLKLKAIYPLTKEFLQLLGYYIAEGYCLNDNSFRISCSEEPGQKLLDHIFEKLNLSYFWINKNNRKMDVGSSSSIFTKILKEIGLGRVSGEKRLPSFFMNLSKRDLSILLKTYFEGDGSVDKEKIIKKRNFNISTTTKSEKLASDLCFALYRYGIFCRCKKLWKRATNTSHRGNWYYRIKISGRTDMSAFLSGIGFQFSRKNNILKDKLDYKENTNVDLIPCSSNVIRKIRLSLRLDQEKLSKLCNCSQSIISAVELGKRRPSRNLITTLIKTFKEQLSSLDHSLFEKLKIFSDSPDPQDLAELINNSRSKQKLTLFELGKRAGVYSSCSKHYIENDLSRILVSKKVKNSPKIYRLGKFLLEFKELSQFADVFEYDFTGWSKIVREALFMLNFPHQAMQREEQKFGYYARRLKKSKSIELRSLRLLAKLLVGYYSHMREAEHLVNELEKLLNFRWDRIKEVKKVKYNKKYVYDLTVKDNKTFLAGHGGLFVHNSNLMSCILWNITNKDYAGMLVLDPHDEYYGRNGLGLKDHPQKDKISYYTPSNPPPGAKSLKINLKKLKPEHFQGATSFSDPQRQCLYAYHRKFKDEWIKSLLEEKGIEGVRFHEDTLSVVKRKLISLLGLEFADGQLHCQGIFDEHAGENTVSNICQDLEQSRIVIIDTSFFSGAIEILVGSLITNEIFERYKYYKKKGQLNEKPVISIVLEEAPRVLGKKVLEQGSNIFDTLAREGRKFKVGLIAITQLPSEIPKNILANMNTKIILGIEMNSERQAIIESSPQDLSQDNRNIASLDIGEALVTSTFTKFAVPIKIPLFKEFVRKEKKDDVTTDFVGVGL